MASEPSNNVAESAKGGIANFVRETRKEIHKVTWPTRREISVTTTMIVVFAVIVACFFWIVDLALGYGISRILGMN